MTEVLWRLIVYLAALARERYLILRYGNKCELCNRPVTAWLPFWPVRSKIAPYRLCAMHRTEFWTEVDSQLAAQWDLRAKLTN